MTDNVLVKVVNDRLELGAVRVSFQRTLRIPETGLHPLPPGLGRFPLRRVADYPDTAPADWLARGGVMLPIYQREAMWLSFDSAEPTALQVGVGKVCAVSGLPWIEQLIREPQNYVALPRQPWLDGINSGDGFIRQFIAVPLGLGATVEGQVTGQEVHGGVQLRAVGLTESALAQWRAEQEASRAEREALLAQPLEPGAWDEGPMSDGEAVPGAVPSMGLGAGGQMRQEVYVDDRPLADYDQTGALRVFVHLCSAAQWTAITGEVPPSTPVDRDAYVRADLPWFDFYDTDARDLEPSAVLSNVQTIGTKLGHDEKPFVPVKSSAVIPLGGNGGDTVTDGDW